MTQPKSRPRSPHDAPSALSEQAVIRAQLTQALAPYRGVLSPERLRELEETLALFVDGQPDVSALAERAVRVSAQEQSGTVPRRDLATLARAHAKRSGGQGEGGESA